jgi:hypothetical protein
MSSGKGYAVFPANVKVLVPGLSVNGVAVTSQCDVANALAASFASVSSSDRYDTTFLRIKDNSERSPLHFLSPNLECYNAPFSVDELLAIGGPLTPLRALMASST